MNDEIRTAYRLQSELALWHQIPSTVEVAPHGTFLQVVVDSGTYVSIPVNMDDVAVRVFREDYGTFIGEEQDVIVTAPRPPLNPTDEEALSFAFDVARCLPAWRMALDLIPYPDPDPDPDPDPKVSG